MSGAPYAIGNPRWPADLRRRTFSSRERYRHARIGLPLALVSKLSTAARRLLIGRPFRSDRLSHTLLPKRIALPVFASDAMSSIAYAPEEIFLVLGGRPGGLFDGAVDRPGGRRGSARGGV